MAVKRPIFTENFSANLVVIETFLGPPGSAAFQRLLNRLFADIVPILCRFPQSGRSFLSRTIKSTKTKALRQRLRRLLHLKDDIRECIMDDYLILYLVRRNQIVFLAVKHHRQLSFDLGRFWQEE